MTGSVPRRLVRAALPVAAAAGVVVAGCARPGAPSGGPQDRRPPVVASVQPEPLSTIEPGDRTLRVRYNERISERPLRGTLADAVTVSPRTGEVVVSHEREGLDVELEGGFRAGLVYRVSIAPTVKDMFENPMAVPFEWVFSTGDSIRPNAVVGQVWDATTGVGVPDALVELRRVVAGDEGPALGTGAPADTFAYFARTDTLGIFALRYLPTGPVELFALQDLDGDGEEDFGEAVRRYRFQLAAADTVVLPPSTLPLLPADTTWAVLEDAEILDSLTLRLEFDDFLDPTAPIEEVLVELTAAVDSTGAVVEAAQGAVAPGIEQVFHEAGFVVWADSVAEAQDAAHAAAAAAAAAAGDQPDAPLPDTVPPDTVPPDTLPPDTLPPGAVVAGAVVPDSTLEAGVEGEILDASAGEGAARPRTPDEFAREASQELLPNGRLVPQTTLVVRLAEPLPAGVPFDLRVERVINLSQLPGGGGTITIEREPPEPEGPPPGPRVPR